ncbi:MAG TPA: hypothetical protein VJO72_06360 [Candidatus Dormibacteraeota bacterium]|nr:hypothetical protein [Candidatus Dormibacteraeota bacterium]
MEVEQDRQPGSGVVSARDVEPVCPPRLALLEGRVDVDLLVCRGAGRQRRGLAAARGGDEGPGRRELPGRPACAGEACWLVS